MGNELDLMISTLPACPGESEPRKSLIQTSFLHSPDDDGRLRVGVSGVHNTNKLEA